MLGINVVSNWPVVAIQIAYALYVLGTNPHMHVIIMIIIQMCCAMCTRRVQPEIQSQLSSSISGLYNRSSRFSRLLFY